MRRSRAMLLAPLTLLTLASCGGGGSQALTMSQFVSEANAICTTSAASSAAVPQPSVSSTIINPGKGDLPTIASFLSKQVTILQSTVDRLKALGTPPSKQSTWTQALAAIQKSVDDAKASQSAAQGGDAPGYETALGRVVQDGTGIDQTFGSFGATACTSTSTGSSPSPSPKH
jgi:hypothetical protein